MFMTVKELFEDMQKIENVGKTYEVDNKNHTIWFNVSKGIKYIFWRNFGQSAIKSNLDEFRWLLKEIFEIKNLKEIEVKRIDYHYSLTIDRSFEDTTEIQYIIDVNKTGLYNKYEVIFTEYFNNKDDVISYIENEENISKDDFMIIMNKLK